MKLAIFLCLATLATLPCPPARAQASIADKALLEKTRALYDAPFQHGLISFDCAVDFDWSQHFKDLLGAVPPAAIPVAERLQEVSHRIFVDRSGATVSAIPKAPDLTSIPHGADLEQIFKVMVAQGVNAWIPSSTDVLLPRGDTIYSFEGLKPGYKLKMQGPGLDATLVLAEDLRISTGVVQLPQPMRLDTIFQPAANGFVLASIATGDTTNPAQSKQATFTYTYQALQQIELPHQITITPNVADKWRYSLSDCKVVKGIVIKVAAPPR